LQISKIDKKAKQKKKKWINHRACNLQANNETKTVASRTPLYVMMKAFEENKSNNSTLSWIIMLSQSIEATHLKTLKLTNFCIFTTWYIAQEPKSIHFVYSPKKALHI